MFKTKTLGKHLAEKMHKIVMNTNILQKPWATKTLQSKVKPHKCLGVK